MDDIYVDQLSIFLENKEGRMLNTLDIIENLGVNIRALSIADTSEFGILRLIVTKPHEVKEELEKRNYIVKITKVLAVSISDEPGGLNTILRILDKNSINLEYLYAFVEQKTYHAIVILKLEDMTEGLKILKEGNANIISPEEIYPSSNALRFISIDFGGRLSFIVVITSSLSNGNDDIAVDAPTIAIFIDNGCPAFNAILLASKLYTSATFESSSDKISSIFG